MVGRAELCGRMTNGSLALLGSGFWGQGQTTGPFIHLPVSHQPAVEGSKREQGGVKAIGSPAHYRQRQPSWGGGWVDQCFRREVCLS